MIIEIQGYLDDDLSEEDRVIFQDITDAAYLRTKAINEQLEYFIKNG